MLELRISLLLLLRSLLFDIGGVSYAAARLLLPLIVATGRQPLTWYLAVVTALLYLNFAPIAGKWNDRDTGKSLLAMALLYPVGEMLAKVVNRDVTSLSIRGHLSWLAEMDDLVHEFNTIRSINAHELRQINGQQTLAELQMRLSDSQDKMVEAMGTMAANLPSGDSTAAKDVPTLNLESLTNTVLLIIWGTQGGGKTTLAKLIARRREQAGHSIVVCDPHGSKQEWEEWQLIGSGRDYPALDAYLKQFDRTITADYEQYSRGNRQFSYSTLLVDEFTQWADRCKSSASFVKSACSDLRKIHRCAILITHSDTLTGLGDAKGLRDAIDRSAVKLQLETKMNASGEYESTGYGWLQYPGQEKQRVKIPRSSDLSLPASSAPAVEMPLDDRTLLERVYQSQVAEHHPFEATLSYEKNIAPFLHYFTTAKAKYGDREGWVSVVKLQQNWGKHNGFNAEEFNQFLQHLTQLDMGKFHPENPASWTDIESTPN